MDKLLLIKEFETLVKKRFNLYDSLFLNLPYGNVENIGTLVPILQRESKEGLKAGKAPQEILDHFFTKQTDIQTEKDKIDFMFKIIQYVERQVVLYDSVEDAAFTHILKHVHDLSIKNFFNQFDNKAGLNKVAEKLSTFSARIVFTAHPTQFYPSRVLDIISELISLIKENRINDVDITLQQLGLTSLLNPTKPTPLDEAKIIIYFLRNVYYEGVSELYSYIKNNIQTTDFDNPDIIKLGFWPGGDRDGNPFVTSQTTMDVADELRMSLMKCYYQDLKQLEKKLTFKCVEDPIKTLRENLYRSMFDTSKIMSYTDILDSLSLVRESVVSKYNSLYLEELDGLINKVKIFKTHFATLDIRQNHDVHKKTIRAILKSKDIITDDLEELDRNDLLSILTHKDLKIKPDEFDQDIIKDTISTISQIQDIQKKNGEQGCNRYIISNSEDIFSVLFVFALFRWCTGKNKNLAIDIIPLFESMEGMNNSSSIMQTLFEIPEYRAHVRFRNNKQTIMLGFSDGTKDGGYLQANWLIFKTKEKLSHVCGQYDIKAIFFDGRGGPPARGGGKTHRFYAAQSDKIANHEIQLTIQGQTITSRFGTKEHFIYNCEQLLTAGLYNSFLNRENSISKHSRHLIERLAQISFEKYNSLKNHKKFIPYLENKSTLKYYSTANIGSRPVKRGNSQKLNLKDLRAISYVGSWSQLKQNVPGYFGIGTALHTLVLEGKLDELKNLFKLPFFKALILNSMMSLSKCYFELTQYLAKDDEYSDFWNILYQEYKLSKEMVLLVSNYNTLMEEELISKSSIEIREKMILPLLIIQQYALQKTAQDSPFKSIYEKMVRRSLYGNINASRNSA